MSTTATAPSIPASAAPATSATASSGTTSTPEVPARPTSLTSVVPTSQYSSYGAQSTLNGAGYGSTYGNTYGGGYGSMGAGYGGYGGMGGMGSSYGSYGGGYGGYGGYGGGYGGMGGYNRFGGGGMMGPNGQPGQSAFHNNTQATFQMIESIVGAFSGFAQMLDSTYMATHSSFFAMMSVAEQFGHLRNSIGSVLGLYALLRWVKSLIAKLTGQPVKSKAHSINAQSFMKFQARGGATSRPSFKPLLFFLAAVFGMPYLINKLIYSMASQQQQPQVDENGHPILTDGVSGQPIDPSKLEFCRALFDFTPENPQIELALRKGDLVAIMAKEDPQGKPSEWWRVRTRDGRSGYVPSTYVEIIPRRIEAVPEATTAPAAADDVDAQKAKNKAASTQA